MDSRQVSTFFPLFRALGKKKLDREKTKDGASRLIRLAVKSVLIYHEKRWLVFVRKQLHHFDERL